MGNLESWIAKVVLGFGGGGVAASRSSSPTCLVIYEAMLQVIDHFNGIPGDRMSNGKVAQVCCG
jgi:hypothetical protein